MGCSFTPRVTGFDDIEILERVVLELGRNGKQRKGLKKHDDETMMIGHPSSLG